MEVLVLHVWLCKCGSLSVLQVAEWLSGDRISAVQKVCRNLWKHYGYTVGHMILWEHYCFWIKGSGLKCSAYRIQAKAI